MNIWQSCKQKRDCLVHFLRLLAVWWPGMQSAWDNYALACNFAKYSPIKKKNFSLTHTHTHPFNGPLSGTTQVSRYQKGKTDLDFTEARDSEWHWHQLGHMQVCTLLQTDNHASTPLLSFYRPDALPAAQTTVSEHWRHTHTHTLTNKPFLIWLFG